MYSLTSLLRRPPSRLSGTLPTDWDLKFSIRKANIDSKIGGYTVLDLTGKRDNIDAALEWAATEGIEVLVGGATGEDEWVIGR